FHTLRDFSDIPNPDSVQELRNSLINNELNYNINILNDFVEQNTACLSEDQQAIFNEIVQA
ncbi:16012_t:CDS:1, partial [Racocetra persica]